MHVLAAISITTDEQTDQWTDRQTDNSSELYVGD